MAYSTRKLSLVSEQDTAPEETPALSDSARPLGTVAATLRAARLAHGSTLPEIADSLRIRLTYLESIEDGRFSDLPGTVYAIGFIRTYADHLGLDAQHLIKKFKEEVEQPKNDQELHFLAAEPERRIPGGSLMLVALLMAAVTYGVWFYVSSTDRTLVDLIPEFPDRFNALLLQKAPVAGEEAEIAAPLGPDGTLATNEQEETADLNLPMESDIFGSPPEEPLAENNAPLPLQAGEQALPTPQPLAQALPEAVQPGQAVTGQAVTGEPLLLPQDTVALLPGTMPAPPAGSPAAPLEPLGTTNPVIVQNNTDAQAQVQPLAQAAPALPIPAAPPVAVPDPAPIAALDQQDLEAAAQPLGQSAAIAAARPPGPPESATFGGENEDSRVLINATAMSWVQVRDDAGNLVMTRVLQPGESYRVPNRSGLQMVTGNAGGIEIFVDGQPTPAFGRPGDVVRNIDLSPDALLNGTAVPN